jgi:cysteinyl-tRNA synthetase
MASALPVVLGGRPVRVLSHARVYVCGITPYAVTHLGHAATYVWLDTAVRVLRHHGVTVEVCRNVTDVDDVLTQAAERAGTPYDELAAIEQFSFDRTMSALGVARPEHEPRAHAYVDPVLRLCDTLLATHDAYVAGGSVYLRGEGVAAQHGLDDAAALALLGEYGENPDDPAQEHPHDVPLWRASTAQQPAWPSPWGPGRPGWHAECAAMALTLLGPGLDLHGGGADLAFPHHAYEAAIAERASAVRPFARHWMRVGLVRHRGAKMAKSTGNLVLVPDLLADHDAAAVRLMVLDRPWSQAWDYTPDALGDAAGALERLYAAAGRPGASSSAADEVAAALRDDLDVPRALAVAEQEGGAAARFALHVLGLDAAHR